MNDDLFVTLIMNSVICYEGSQRGSGAPIERPAEESKEEKWWRGRRWLDQVGSNWRQDRSTESREGQPHPKPNKSKWKWSSRIKPIEAGRCARGRRVDLRQPHPSAPPRCWECGTRSRTSSVHYLLQNKHIRWVFRHFTQFKQFIGNLNSVFY